MTATNGLLLIDKPAGMTSHTVVSRVRRALAVKRVGHAGTLDPMATGLLVIGVGPATRLLQYCQQSEKRYTGTAKFGVATDSLDADGLVTATARVPALSEEQMNESAVALTGDITQIPPMVSAIKHQGQRLYELARQGVEVERTARPVTISTFTLTPTGDPTVWHFDVTCSVGTYVRVLLADLAERIGTVGHLTALRRESSGSFHVGDALSLDALDQRASAGTLRVAPARDMVRDFATVAATPEQVAQMRRGQRPHFAASAEEVAVLDGEGELVGLARRREEAYQPFLVLPVGDEG